MGIRVIKAGILDTIQDEGRKGNAVIGINPGGVMDPFSFYLSNALVGNPLNEAVLEMHFPAPELYFESDHIIALTGADFSCFIDGVSLLPGRAAVIKAGSTLYFKKPVFGQRCYLAIRGGFDLPVWMGSKSTNTIVKMGGLEGRQLKNGDLLKNSEKVCFKGNTMVMSWFAVSSINYSKTIILNLLPGPEWHWLSVESKHALLNSSFVLNCHSNRMGILLDGPKLNLAEQKSLLSSGVAAGTLQLLPNGSVVVLMADRQTTGGYPRVAVLSASHIPLLAQAGVNTAVQFSEISLEKSVQQWLKQMENIQQVAGAATLKWLDVPTNCY